MIARVFVAVSIVALAVTASAQDRLYGKTLSQAATMGYEKWLDHIGAQPGADGSKGQEEAEKLYSEGQYFYLAALYDRNAQAASRLSEKRAMALDEVRARFNDLSTAIETAGMASTNYPESVQSIAVESSIQTEAAIWIVMKRRKLPADTISGNLFREILDQFRESTLEMAKDQGKDPKDLAEPLDAVEAAFYAAIESFDGLSEREANLFRKLIAFWLDRGSFELPFTRY